MKNYRRYGQAQDELDGIFEGYNRAGNAFVQLDEVIRRYQKVKKVYKNEVATLKAMRQMLDDILEIIEDEGKEVEA
jgi:exonuclease VII small subunit